MDERLADIEAFCRFVRLGRVAFEKKRAMNDVGELAFATRSSKVITCVFEDERCSAYREEMFWLSDLKRSKNPAAGRILRKYYYPNVSTEYNYGNSQPTADLEAVEFEELTHVAKTSSLNESAENVTTAKEIVNRPGSPTCSVGKEDSCGAAGTQRHHMHGQVYEQPPATRLRDLVKQKSPSPLIHLKINYVTQNGKPVDPAECELEELKVGRIRKRAETNKWMRGEFLRTHVDELVENKKQCIVDSVRMFYSILYEFSENRLKEDTASSVCQLVDGNCIEKFSLWIKQSDFDASTKQKRLQYISSAISWLTVAYGTKKMVGVLNTYLSFDQLQCAKLLVCR